MGDPYISVEKDYKPNDIKYREAAHVMFFARTKRKLWDKLPYGAFINMHLRFDGRLGFPGGLIDKVDFSEPDSVSCYLTESLYQGENVEEALNREVAEEMGEGNPRLVSDDWVHSHYSLNDKILLHFYTKEVTFSC